MARHRSVRLLVMGGGVDPDESHMRLLPHLVSISGGKQARIIICSSPSEKPAERVREYRRLFEKIGVAEVIEAPISMRHDAKDPTLLASVERATAVFFTGGDQLRLTSRVAGTDFGERVRARVLDGELVAAGTSAGAAAMSSTMIIRGKSGGTVRRSDLELAPGLDLWPNTVVDTHFNQRGRASRMLTVFAHNPQVLGLGIDENTAVDVTLSEGFTVIGAGAVTVFDGRVSYSSAPDVDVDQVLTVTDNVVHVLSDGYGYDLTSSRPRLPGGGTIPPL